MSDRLDGIGDERGERRTARTYSASYKQRILEELDAATEPTLRQAMTRNQVPSLPLYPEARPTNNPTGSLILKLYADITRHAITKDGTVLHAYPVNLTDTQRQVLNLLAIPHQRYTDA